MKRIVVQLSIILSTKNSQNFVHSLSNARILATLRYAMPFSADPGTEALSAALS